jgi:biopolymer transport protein ExbD
MNQRSKYVALALGLIVLAVIVVLALARRGSRSPKTGFDVQAATSTCACPLESGLIVLYVHSNGKLAINLEPVSSEQLSGELSRIYEMRVQRVLYLFPDNDTSFERIAEIIDKVKHLRTKETKGIPVPKELGAAPENMNIQIRLVTPEALKAPCPMDCYNWGTQGFPTNPIPAR